MKLDELKKNQKNNNYKTIKLDDEESNRNLKYIKTKSSNLFLPFGKKLKSESHVKLFLTNNNKIIKKCNTFRKKTNPFTNTFQNNKLLRIKWKQYKKASVGWRRD